MERPVAIIYDLRVLWEGPENYKTGMSNRAQMVIASKADLLAVEGDPEEVRLAQAKVARLEEFVRDEMDRYDWVLDVVPTSGKYSQSLHSVVRKLRANAEIPTNRLNC
jgi:GTP-binding protein